VKRLLVIALVTFIAFLASSEPLAAPPAGTVIGNQATATYNDAVGTARTATSNLVQTTVTQVKSFTLTANGARTAAPGQTVYYPHTITNTGNGTDTYALNAPVSSAFGAAGPHVSLAYFIDANGDGVPDNSSPINTSGAIAAGGTFRFVVAGTVPATAVSGDSANITVSVSDTSPATATNTDTTTVANSVITVTKSMSANVGPSPFGPITVTLSYMNTGTAAANAVQVIDALNAGLTYIPGTGRWSVSGGTVLTDASDGVEQGVAFPPGIDYRSTLGAGATVTAIIPTIPAGASGNITFQVNVNPGLAPQTINNNAQYQTASQLPAFTNVASYQVQQGAIVVANGSNTNSTNGTGEPVTVASAAAGSSFTFADFIWNRGNGSDTFDIAVQSNTFPAGTTFTLLQQDGATTLINSGGAAAPDTGPVPGAGQACPAPYVTDVSGVPNICGYRVVVRVTLPANAPAGSYSLTLRATSAFNNAVFDDVIDTLAAVSANTVDITNDVAAPPAGAAAVGDGLGATGATIIRTNVVAPAPAAASTTRFRVWVANTGAVADTFNLTSAFAATTAAGVTPPTLPAGWSVAFFADNSGAPANCTTLGAPLTSTGVVAPGAARLVCAQVTVSSLASGTALAGDYDFDFTATSQTNAAVNDVKRDRVTVGAVRAFTLVPNNAGQTFANGTVNYTHTLTNTGNGTDTANFAAACLGNSQPGWAATAYLDANANGLLDVGTDTVIVCGTTSVTLNVGESRSVFVSVTAPGTVTSASPANITTIAATYSATISATDTTSTTNGLVIVKEQQGLGPAGCANNNAPAAGYSQSALPASPITAAGSCIAYRVTMTNTTALPVTAITLNDIVPANTRMHYACSGNGAAAPSITVGAVAGTTPADGASGTVAATVPALAAAQATVLYFCVQVDAATPVGTVLSNTATGTATQGVNSLTPTSNTVVANVGAAAGVTYGGVLQANTSVASEPGATVFIKHTLTNTGSVPDTFNVLTAALPAISGYAFTSITLFPDANNDGQPDGAVPLANPIVLASGQVLRFVVRLVVPGNVVPPAISSIQIGATSAGGATIAPIRDSVVLQPVGEPVCGIVNKSFSRASGPSPARIKVTLDYMTCDKPRPRITISDVLPAGMHYVPGSGRSTLTGSTPLTDAIVGDDLQGTTRKIAYDWNGATPGIVSARLSELPLNDAGSVSFDVEIDAGLALGTKIENIGIYNMDGPNGPLGGNFRTNPATYLVTSRVDLTLTGQRLPTATPGTTATFTNVLTNKGDAADTFDITVTANTWPAGTVVALFKSDGVTPLADTDGNGTPDTGPVAPGATYNVVVKVTIPATAVPATYKITKMARSTLAPSRTAVADDIVDTLELRCSLSLDPDNQSLIGFGQHVTYTHHLTNRGNCEETVRAMLDYLGDSRPGWTSAAYIDNKVAGGGSIPGVVDATDLRITQGWSQLLKPAESVRVLVDVFAPTLEQAVAALAGKSAAVPKQITDSNVTTLVITGATVGPLVVHDTTTVDAANIPPVPENAIRNFTGNDYATPTVWGVIGRDLFLRADAKSCNADPNAVDSRTVVITGPNGEREEATATETAANSGIFNVPALPVRSPPVAAGNGRLEGNPNDVFEVELLGCGRRIDTVVTLMQASSVVFDSHSNENIALARVTLRNAAGGTCSNTTATVPSGNSNPVVTDSNGRYTMQAAPGDYCLFVEPPNGYRFPSQVAYTLLPPGHNLNVADLTRGGSYGTPFRVLADGFVVVDLPVDTVAQDGLFVQKDASRAVAEIGDFVDYTVRARNGTGNVLDRADVILADDLPLGFAYVAGTARRDGTALADPANKGPRLVFALGHLDRGQQVTITYRVRIGPGAMQGDGVNRVQARYTALGATTISNVATARVQVTGGVFTDKGFILGKVYMDCNANGVQDKGEPGVPGVRLVLEDGTYIITDGGGKFSFYGISNRTHVLKADRTTLPAGSRLVPLGTRNLGDGASRMVDLKAGEMQRADFAIAGCDEAVVNEVKARQEKSGARDELAMLVGTQLTTEARVITDVKALPAAGVVELTANGFNSSAAPTAPTDKVTGEKALAKLPTPAPQIDRTDGVLSSSPAPSSPAAVRPLEEIVPELDNKLGFIGLADGQTLPAAQAPIRVKGVAGATFRLAVNGEAVPEARVGKRSVLEDKQVQAWEYIGVELRPGTNTIAVTQVDSFGNERGTETIRVVAPGRLARIAIELPAGGGIADGKTPVKVVVKVSDRDGVPVTSRTAVTLEASRGAWLAEDADPKQQGLQVFVEGGRGEFELRPPLEPGEAFVVAQSGAERATMRVDFLPELREMIASGVLEGIVNARHLSTRSIMPARASDGFEQELRQISREWNDGKTAAGARAAFFLKGKIKGEYLLTAAYDSDKDTKERLFRDIQPDEFYPIYGDSAVRGFDAQSTSKLYVRVDKGRSYLLWGDFTTNSPSETRKLSNYNRSLTGVSSHWENDRVNVNAFASRDTTRQVIEELRATGTSGPFQLGTQGALVNSEKIEIITRDRNQPAIIVATVPQSRFSDYEIETLTGRILFKSPIASVDRDLNPVFVRVTYEVDQGGPEFWVAGIDAQVKLGDRVEVGGTYVKDQNPLLPFTLAGANLAVKLGASTYVIAEVARTVHGIEDVAGNAGRIEVKHDGTDLKANLYVGKTELGFDNPGSYLSQGRSEAGGKLEYRLSERTTIRAEALRTEDLATNSVRDGAMASVQYHIADKLSFEIGVRHASEKGTSSPIPPVQGQPAPQPMPDAVTTIRARLTGPMPFVAAGTIYGEAEVDVQDSDRRILAVGGEYTMGDKGRIYARHEFISSITGPYGLNPTERQNTTAIGVDTEYMKDGRVFSEYRIRDAISGGDAEAAFGLKNLWSIGTGLRLGTTFERVHSLSGTGQNENTALALALEYTGSPDWKGSTRLELRDGASQEQLLFTVGLAARLARDWTALARNAYTLTRNKTGGGEQLVDRMQAGLAWRDNETNKWNALGRVESRIENNDSQAGVALRSSTQIVSVHADWQPIRPFLVTGRYAAKWSEDKSNGLSTKYRAQVVGGRVTWEFAPKWDVGLASSAIFGDGSSSHQYAAGIEVGYLLATNLWVSAGFNFTGYKDADLAGADYTTKGAFVRLRYKFDEAIFDNLPGHAAAAKKEPVALAKEPAAQEAAQ
jgi:uncharacterized repeat protein (TIGR01451 family)